MSSTRLTIKHLLSIDDYSSEQAPTQFLLEYFTLDAHHQVVEGMAIYHYKRGPIAMALPAKPTTKDDFFALAKAILTGQYYQHPLEIFHQTDELTPSMLHELRCDLLSDASRAGHEEARKQLIDLAALRGDQVASRKLELTPYNCKDGLRIFLPKLFNTAEELQMLGIHLRESGVGSYYRMEKPEHAHKLSQHFLAIAAKKRREEYDLMMEQMRQRRENEEKAKEPVKTRNTKVEEHDPVREMYLSRISTWNNRNGQCKTEAPQDEAPQWEAPSFAS